MVKGASRTHVRAQRLGTLAVVLLAAAGVPGRGLAQGNAAQRAAATPREARRAGPVTVALGATASDPHARDLLARALEDAVSQNPALRLSSQGTLGASLVVNARIRSLTVSHDAAGTLARCDLGVVVADGTGAVRAMLDARRIVRAGSTESSELLEQHAVHSAADGVVRDLVSQMVR